MTLPRDVGLGKDDFQKSKIYNTTDSLINYILNILLMKPGNMPSQPKLGVDINKYVQTNMDALDTELLKGMIATNCSDLIPYLTNDDIYVGIVADKNDGKGILLISIPLLVDVDSKERTDVYYAFYRDELNSLKFSFLIDKE